jgi:hypothetical protein
MFVFPDVVLFTADSQGFGASGGMTGRAPDEPVLAALVALGGGFGCCHWRTSFPVRFTYHPIFNHCFTCVQLTLLFPGWELPAHPRPDRR